MADDTNNTDDDQRDKRRQQRRRARKRLNIAIWSALILSTAGNVVSGTLEFWRSREEHREIVQLVERCDKRGPEVNNGEVTWRELDQGAEHLGTVKDAIHNLPYNPAAMDHYEHLIKTIGQRVIVLANKVKPNKEAPGADVYEKAVRELEDLIAGWDQHVRDEDRAERLYGAATKIQSVIEKLMTFGAFSSDRHRESDTVLA